MANSLILARLDWFTIMYYDVTLRNCFEILQLDDHILDDELLASSYERSFGWDTSQVFVFNNIQFSINLDVYRNAGANVFDQICRSVRIDISSKGLDYLRSIGNDVDNDFPHEEYWSRLKRFVDDTPLSFKITRCDFAFDFFNYKPEFIRNLDSYLHECTCNGFSSVMISGAKGPLKYSVRTGGDQFTVYLGGTGGDRLLRIYDKKLQYFNRDGSPRQPLPACFSDLDLDQIDSWFRIELQARRKFSAILFSIGEGGFSLHNVLRNVFDHYTLVDKNREVLPFFKDFFDFEALPPVTVGNFVFYGICSVLERSEEYLKKQCIRTVVTLFARYGVDGFIDLINQELRRRYTSDDYSSRQFCKVLFKQISELKEQEHLSDIYLKQNLDGYYV